MIPGIKYPHPHDVVERLALRLARAGHRATHPRRAVLEQVAAQKASFTASELLASVNKVAPEVGRATVFRTLDLLVELDLLRRVHTEAQGNWGHSYILCDLGDTHHHHLVCTGCGQVSDFAGCTLEAFDALVDSVQVQTSFHVEGHNLELYGVCARCQREEE